MSNIEVLVEWDCSTVFAGEEVKCTITFRNIASASKISRSPSPITQLRGLGNARDRWKPDPLRPATHAGSPPLTQRSDTAISSSNRQNHRSTMSLSTTIVAGRHSPSISSRRGSEQAAWAGGTHKKSVSIISLGSSTGPMEDQAAGNTSAQVRNFRKAHNRSTSLQGLPMRGSSQYPASTGHPDVGPKLSVGSSRSATSPLFSKKTLGSHARRTSQSPEFLPPISTNGVLPHHSGNPNPPRDGLHGTSDNIPGNGRIGPTANGHMPSPSISVAKPTSDGGESVEDRLHNRQLQRVLSPINVEETPRSSMDIYSHSNHSSETLASEYVEPNLGRLFPRPSHRRQASRLVPEDSCQSQEETLMMGYVQLVGSFTLDGSLINLAPFESIKRKGVIGGQGSGGVVGVETSKRDSGLFGSLGWNSIGQSLGSLLGPQEPSSFREMKGLANSKSVPILSTPQSILFVDLKLGPGQSKRYSYRQQLPRGIPPTHRGRAFKAAYHLVIGIQRPGSNIKQKSVRRIDVPFKVYPGVNGSGEIMGHDLMNPHILLKDMASTLPLDDIAVSDGIDQLRDNSENGSSDDGLKSYIESLLQSSQANRDMGLLSPTESSTPGSSRDFYNQNASMKELINLATLRGIPVKDAKTSANRFQISRDGDKVATVALIRSAYRLGEVVHVVVDLQHADIICSALIVALETSEVVDPAIALRSSASIYRATRRVHAQQSENTICARRVAFGLMIPTNATPGFVTTGVTLEWKLRFEFVTGDRQEDLIEKLTEDDRGTVSSAAQEMSCQSFDVCIPLRVYGSTAGPEEDTIAGKFAI